ncbi:MAG TPA: Ppx/GppA phosphatase family protein [Candidatus Limnocylindria bacterium]|nr:Ppx/GppA phosphatase family protein [Candidatus Limnocylindria bacterium]
MPRRAVIDIGTNSVKVLVADVVGGAVTPLWETSEQTRLGRGFYETHCLQPGPIAATATAVARFVAEARTRGAESVRVIATSAARDATNRDELLACITAASGLTTEVISGETEAEWAFAGVASAPELAQQRLLVLDVGGGSTEFILGAGSHVDFRESFPLGSVRVLERLNPGDAPSPESLTVCRAYLRDFLRQEVAPRLTAAFTTHGRPERTLGVGGSTALLALIQHAQSEFRRDLIEGTHFDRPLLSTLVNRLWSLPLAERRLLPGLPPERADVILTGAAIYEAVLDVFVLPELGISTRGLRFAAVMDPPAPR